MISTAARNRNSIGDRMETKPWEKPGSVGGQFSSDQMKPAVQFQTAAKSDCAEKSPVQIYTSTFPPGQTQSSLSTRLPWLSTSDLNPQSSSFTITDHHISSPAQISCCPSSLSSSIIIITAGGLVLLLIFAVLLVVAVWKRKKKTCGLVSSSAEGVNLTENRRTENAYVKGKPSVFSNLHTAQRDDGFVLNKFHRPANTETVDTDLDYMNVAAAERNAVDPDQIYTELNSSRQSDVYQSLRTDSVQEESIYHSIGQTLD
ncbi:uncharacterized protein LOC127949536 [Carassius gibelio]|uniref:uncharacterized protein LOC127949536 n=1 Tax=Carassius gibelio TaxID=101364 RepID=UPI002277A3AC|nr:uncharacterized protein LOC127949536 [Carassius gibelio]